ncbi:pimeloyl-ACP methyl esterase BioG family protein [Pontibaca methylaminivorans]|uniref:pimeloyl-ACP methyl esterase BioG family protein n=1 Tax=Pontibaca methylaminivorans TaxID=515897 RepID=UPI002FD9F69F
MKVEWLHRGGAPSLIVVLTGWAAGAGPFRHLAGAGSGARDVLVLSDYRDLSMPRWPEGYETVDLVAWSFGVAAACRLPPAGLFRRRVALCGSWMPCDDDLGIPRALLQATKAGLSALSLQKFARRAGCDLPEDADIGALREELETVMGWEDVAVVPDFDRVVLGAADRIFSRRNLDRAWRGRAGRIEVLDCGHNPFGLWCDWDEVLA